MRAIRNTTLSCGLLSCPVKIYSATEDEREIKFNLIGSKGEPVEQIYVLKEHPLDQMIYTGRKKEYVGRRVVEQFEREDMGYAWNGTPIDKAQLDQAEKETLIDPDGNDLSEIIIDKFILLKNVPWERGKKLYFIGPNKALSGKAFETFKAAIRRKKVAAIAKVVVKKRQMLLCIYEKDGAMLALSMRYTREMRERDEGVNDDLIDTRVKLNRKEIDAMSTLVEEYMVDAEEINNLTETYVKRKVDIVESIINGAEPKAKRGKRKAEPKKTDLMAELEASIKEAKKTNRKVKV